MAFCTHCGSLIPDGSKFCPDCGAQVGQGQANPANTANPVGQEPNYQQINLQQQPNYQQTAYGYGAQGAQYNPYQQRQAGQPAGIIFGQRNVLVCVLLTFITCGFYGLYWMIKVADEVREGSGDASAPSGGMVIVLSLVTCGIYSFIWLYKCGERINTAKAMRNLPTDSNAGLIYLLLAIFGLSIVSIALLQGELNKVAAFDGAPPA